MEFQHKIEEKWISVEDGEFLVCAVKIEDFENWIRDKEPVDSIEDVTSYKVH